MLGQESRNEIGRRPAAQAENARAPVRRGPRVGEGADDLGYAPSLDHAEQKGYQRLNGESTGRSAGGKDGYRLPAADKDFTVSLR